jgi:hypothetical protein
LGSDPDRRRWHVARRAAIQSQLAQYVFAHIARVCAAVAVRRSYIAFRDVAVRYVAVLRPQCPWADFANVLSDIAYDSTVAWLLTGEPAVLPHLSIILADFATVQSAVAFVQPHVAAVFPDESFVQSGVSAM